MTQGLISTKSMEESLDLFKRVLTALHSRLATHLHGPKLNQQDGCGFCSQTLGDVAEIQRMIAEIEDAIPKSMKHGLYRSKTHGYLWQLDELGWLPLYTGGAIGDVITAEDLEWIGEPWNPQMARATYELPAWGEEWVNGRQVGVYRDTTNGDLWTYDRHGWRWVNGAHYNFVPETLVYIGTGRPSVVYVPPVPRGGARWGQKRRGV